MTKAIQHPVAVGKAVMGCLWEIPSRDGLWCPSCVGCYSSRVIFQEESSRKKGNSSPEGNAGRMSSSRSGPTFVVRCTGRACGIAKILGGGSAWSPFPAPDPLPWSCPVLR